MTIPAPPASKSIRPVDSNASKVKRRFTQEKIMLALCLVFFGGILLLTIFPEPYKGVAMGALSILTLFILFKVV